MSSPPPPPPPPPPVFAVSFVHIHSFAHSIVSSSSSSSVCPFCSAHERQKGLQLVDTGTAIVSRCCRLTCLDCRCNYTACDCTEFPRSRLRHPAGDDSEWPQTRPLCWRSFGSGAAGRRCPICWRKHSFRCPRCRSTRATTAVALYRDAAKRAGVVALPLHQRRANTYDASLGFRD